MTSVAVLNGPDLEPHGHHTKAEIAALCRATAAELGLDLTFRQSNHEGHLIEWIHQEGAAVAAGNSIGAVLNPGALTTSVALHDAIVSVDLPVIEVHISNIYAREVFRRHSAVSPAARSVVVGLGIQGYALAIRGLRELAMWESERPDIDRRQPW